MRTLLVIALLCSLAVIEASHFRGGFINFKNLGNNKVTLKFTHVWRATAPDYIGVYMGDGSSASFSPVNEIFSGTDAAGEAYKVYVNEYTYQYKSSGVFYAYWENCCRVYSMVNSPSSNFKVGITIDLTTGMSSPVVTIPPLIQLPKSTLAQYQIGVADPSNNPVSCRLATATESDITSYATIASNQISVTPGCLIQWNTAAGNAGDKYSVGIIVEQQVNGKKASTAPIDFAIEIVDKKLPTCTVSTSSSVAPIGQTWTATITGTSTEPTVTSLTVSALNLASDATLSPAAGSSGNIPFAVTLSVTPTKSGAYSTAVVFKDQNNLQASCTVAYTVPEQVACAVTVNSCSTKNGQTTYKLSSASTVDSNPTWTSTCGTGFSPAQGSSVSLTTSASPNALCNATATLTSGQQTYKCPITLQCPLCSSGKTPCRVDTPATYQVSDPASIDAYNNGDVLAVGTDSDGVITTTTALNLPPGVAVYPNGTFYVSDQTQLDSLSYNVTVTTTDVNGGVTTQVITLVFLSIACGEGLESCGFQCYNPTVHTCFVFNGHRHMCAVNQYICNMTEQCCYNPADQDCINGTLCPKNFKKCNTDCYNPVDRSCLPTSSGSSLLCIKDWKVCGTACYDPNTFNCHNDAVTCLKTEGFCGSGCYDPNASDCDNGKLIPKGNKLCGLSNYDPNTHACWNGNTLCPVGMKLCGAACYWANQHTCMGDFSLCPAGQDHKCGTACYNDAEYVCCNPSTESMCYLLDSGCHC